MRTCDNVKCGSSHIGKFDSCRDEALYQISLDSWGERTGDVDFGQCVDLLILETVAIVDLYLDNLVAIQPGNYMVSTVSSGQVFVSKYDTELEARQVFDCIDRAYSNWLNDEEES